MIEEEPDEAANTWHRTVQRGSQGLHGEGRRRAGSFGPIPEAQPGLAGCLGEGHDEVGEESGVLFLAFEFPKLMPLDK